MAKLQVGDYVETVKRIRRVHYTVTPRGQRGTVVYVSPDGRFVHVEQKSRNVFDAHPSELTRLLRRSETEVGR